MAGNLPLYAKDIFCFSKSLCAINVYEDINKNIMTVRSAGGEDEDYAGEGKTSKLSAAVQHSSE